MTSYKGVMPTIEDGTLAPLIERVLAARPSTRDELDDLAEAIDWDAEAALETLTSLGFIKFDGDELRVVDPVRALTANAGSALDQAKASFDEAQQLLALLASVKASQTEAAAGAEMIGAVIRDHESVWERWWADHAHITPVRPGVVTPDAVMLRNQVLGDIDRVAADFIERDFHMRVILDIEECADENGEIPEWLRQLIGAGVEVRAMVQPPSWFYIDDGVMGGIPLTWGQGNPAGMVVLQPSPLLAMAAAFFEFLWQRATPIKMEAPDGWEPVMRLLEVGRSDKQIADALGLGARTVRRRIADAMDELGATTRFELGMCWAQRQQHSS